MSNTTPNVELDSTDFENYLDTLIAVFIETTIRADDKDDIVENKFLEYVSLARNKIIKYAKSHGDTRRPRLNQVDLRGYKKDVIQSELSVIGSIELKKVILSLLSRIYHESSVHIEDLAELTPPKIVNREGGDIFNVAEYSGKSKKTIKIDWEIKDDHIFIGGETLPLDKGSVEITSSDIKIDILVSSADNRSGKIILVPSKEVKSVDTFAAILKSKSIENIISSGAKRKSLSGYKIKTKPSLQIQVDKWVSENGFENSIGNYEDSNGWKFIPLGLRWDNVDRYGPNGFFREGGISLSHGEKMQAAGTFCIASHDLSICIGGRNVTHAGVDNGINKPVFEQFAPTNEVRVYDGTSVYFTSFLNGNTIPFVLFNPNGKMHAAIDVYLKDGELHGIKEATLYKNKSLDDDTRDIANTFLDSFRGINFIESIVESSVSDGILINSKLSSFPKGTRIMDGTSISIHYAKSSLPSVISDALTIFVNQDTDDLGSMGILCNKMRVTFLSDGSLEHKIRCRSIDVFVDPKSIKSLLFIAEASNITINIPKGSTLTLDCPMDTIDNLSVLGGGDVFFTSANIPKITNLKSSGKINAVGQKKPNRKTNITF